MGDSLLAAAAVAAGLLLSAAPATAQEQPRQGGVLTIRINSDMRATDGINRDANTDTILHHIFETLVAYRDDLTIGPELAQSWKVSDDGLTYAFKLRDGATFHNGDPVTSADVKWNWKWRMDPKQHWRCSAYFNGKQGLKVESVETPDPRTVVFKINHPDSLFLAQLADIQCNDWIASPKNVGADGKWIQGSAIGSGPFELETWKKGQYVLLKRFPGYEPLKVEESGYAGARVAYVDQVKFLIIPDISAAETALYAGQIDVLPELDPTHIAEARKHGVKVLSAAGLSWTPILIQTKDPLMSNVKMRLAIAHAIDIDQIAATRTDGLAKGDPSGVARASAFFNKSFLDWPKYDPAEAKKLLAEAGYKGQPVTIQTNTRYQFMYENSILVQAMLQAVGINAKLEVLDWATQLDNYLTGKFQLQSFGYSARLDPSLLYGILIGDKDKVPTKQWDNKEAYDLYLKSTRVSDFKERQALFEKIHALMAKDVPIIGLYYEPVVDGIAPGVKGFKVWAAGKPRAWGAWKAN